MSEGAPTEVRVAARDELFRMAGRRRFARRARRIALSAASLLVLALGFWRSHRSNLIDSSKTTAPYARVRTQPLPAEVLVVSRHGGAAVSRSTNVPAEIVRTTPSSGGFRRIGDPELLALAASRSVVLYRTDPSSERLLFADPQADKESPVN